MEVENSKPRALDIYSGAVHCNVWNSERIFYDALPRVFRDLVAVGRKKLKKNNLHTYRQRGKQGQVVYKTEG